jgi:CDP-diacylglycerol--glycerol-3-phosphate 3-phosphatidyltransferase
MVIFYLLNVDWAFWVATIIYVIAASTDFLDGYVARKYNCVTTFGKFLDPIVDKILVVAAFLLVIERGDIIPAPYGSIGMLLILTREFLVAALRQCAAGTGTTIAADTYGKLKTLAQDITAPVLMMIPVIAGWWIGFLWIGYVLYAISIILTIFSGWNYIWNNRSVLIGEDMLGKKAKTKEDDK